MFKRYLNSIKRGIKSSKPNYIAYCSLPIDEKAVLLEGGQGSNINGNMFAMLKELCENPRWKEYKSIFIVTEDTLEKARKRMAFYNFKGVKLCVRDSDEYCKYLATAKYLLTDNTFPPYFNKRDEQIFVNTWHGTPLKTLGKSNKSSLATIANVQKNYLCSDYALFPNEFTRDVFMNDYDLEPTFKNYSFIGNYPRNYIFYDEKAGEKVKEKLGLKGKKLFAYMPTWRDANTEAQKKSQLKKTQEILDEFESMLDDSTVLLVNLHFLLSSEINCDGYKHVQYFSNDFDTYEILNACDGLVTDYSSVFFDFAVTRKKVILFAYDKHDYLSSRGLYMPFEELPFPIVEEVKDVVELFKTDIPVPDDFIEKYCPNGSERSCEKLFELMVTGKSDCYKLEHTKSFNKPYKLLYAGNLTKKRFVALKDYIDENPNYNYVVAYRKALAQENKDAIEALSENASLGGILTAYQFTVLELIAYAFCVLFKVFKSKKLRNMFTRERKRLFPNMEPESVVLFAHNIGFMAGILLNFQCKKEAIIYYGMGRMSKFVKKGYKALNVPITDNREKELQRALCNENEEEKSEFIKALSKMNNIAPLYFNIGYKMICVSPFSFKTPVDIKIKDTRIVVGDVEYKAKFLASNKSKKNHMGFYSFTIPVKDVIDLPTTNHVYVRYKLDGINIDCLTRYFSPLKSKFAGLRGPMNVYKPTNTVAIFRQSMQNVLNIYVRSVNVTDSIHQRLKQYFAFFCSLLWRTKKAKKLVLLYEKNSSKYEESASVLYEKLIDKGYNNAYFIVDRNYEYIDVIPEKYRKNIIYKYTFKHYLYFFKSKTFIGTEAIVHSFDLKTFNVLPLYKISRKNLNYVFLQHGVMYMVSLDSESRRMFKRKKLTGKYRVVVSSRAEAEHFVTLGRHFESDLYVTGLPKFDRNTLNDDADKIVIMPTWRPWEINVAREDFSETPYFKMLMKLYNNVPDSLKEKVIILPHPLIVNELSKASPSVVDKIVLDARYDDILKQARLLITDYSSIAYDAFYRGSRVIFYWEEKDYCMEQYGPSTKLMLNEGNVYGDYFYSEEGLSEAILNNYNNPQTEEYKERYGKLVDFHDGKNTERLIELLKFDDII